MEEEGEEEEKEEEENSDVMFLITAIARSKCLVNFQIDFFFVCVCVAHSSRQSENRQDMGCNK